MSQSIKEWEDDFRGQAINPTDWTAAVTDTAGVPTCGVISSPTEAGECALTLDATSEVQTAKLTQNNILWLPYNRIREIEFWVKIHAEFGSATSLFFGLMSAFNATPGSITNRLLFRKTGTGNILIETGDGTHSVTSGNDTGLNFVADTYKRFSIDFGVGGLGDVHFGVSGAYGQQQRQLKSVKFDVSSMTGGLQLGAYLAKTSSTNVAAVTIDRVKVRYAH